MSGNTISITMTADDRDVLSSYQKQQAEILKNQRALINMGNAGTAAGRNTKTNVDSATQSLKTFLTAVTGVGSVVGGLAAAAAQLRREYETILQRQKTAADRQVNFADSLSQAIRNAGGLLSGAEVEKSTLGISERTGVEPAKVAQALGAALSARGATNKQQAQEAITATGAALKFAPELDAEGAASLAGVAIDVSKRFGVSPQKAIGFIQNVGGLARVTDLPNLVQNVAPAVNNLTQFGFSPQEAGSLVTTLTQGTGDFSGNLSSTAALAFADSLRERFPGENPRDVINKLRADPALRSAFLEGGKIGGKKFGAASLGKGKAKPTIEQILEEGTLFASQFDEGIGKIGTFEDGGKTYQDTLREINSVATVQNARIQRYLKTGAQQLSIVDISGGLASISREGLEDALKSSGASDLDLKFARTAFEFDGGLSENAPTDRVTEILRQRADYLSRTTDFVSNGSAGVGAGGGFEVPRTPTEQETQMAQILSRLATAIETLTNEQKPQKVEVVNGPAQNRGKRPRQPKASENNRN